MILKSIQEYIEQAGRVEQSALLKHFHISREGLDVLMAPLLKCGKIQKTLHQRGDKLPASVYYSCPLVGQIPSLTVI